MDNGSSLDLIIIPPFNKRSIHYVLLVSSIVGRLVGRSVSRSVGQSVNWSIGQSVAPSTIYVCLGISEPKQKDPA